MLEYLRKETFQLRSKNYLLRSDLHELKLSHQTLTLHSSSQHASYEALRSQSAALSRDNKTLTFASSRERRELMDVKRELAGCRFGHGGEMTALRREMREGEIRRDGEIRRLRGELRRRAGGNDEDEDDDDQDKDGGTTRTEGDRSGDGRGEGGGGGTIPSNSGGGGGTEVTDKRSSSSSSIIRAAFKSSLRSSITGAAFDRRGTAAYGGGGDVVDPYADDEDRGGRI